MVPDLVTSAFCSVFSAFFYALVNIWFFPFCWRIYSNETASRLVHRMFAWYVIGMNFFGIKHEVYGLERVPEKSPVIFLAIHNSYYDSILLPHLARKPVIFVKKELGYVPGVSGLVRLPGFVTVDRRGGVRGFFKGIKQLASMPREDLRVVLFPQGTRGNSLEESLDLSKRPIKKGFLHVCHAIPEAYIVPVVHNIVHYAGRRVLSCKKKGKITLHFLEPIARNGCTDAELYDRVKRLFIEGISRL